MATQTDGQDIAESLRDMMVSAQQVDTHVTTLYEMGALRDGNGCLSWYTDKELRELSADLDRLSLKVKRARRLLKTIRGYS